MRKAWFLMFLVLFLFAVSGNVIAASKVGTFGTPNSSGTYSMEVDDDRIITVASDAGFKVAYEAAVTGDTLTAVDSGKVITLDCSTGTNQCTFSLPDAAVGLNYTFVAIDDEAFYVDPLGTDLILYSSLTAGDRITNTSAATGDSISLTCTVADYWAVSAINGTWADGN